jgi:hypothetical protein
MAGTVHALRRKDGRRVAVVDRSDGARTTVAARNVVVATISTPDSWRCGR